MAGSPGYTAPATEERARSPTREATVPADEGQVESCSDDDGEAGRTPSADAPALDLRARDDLGKWTFPASVLGRGSMAAAEEGPGEGAMIIGEGAPADDAAEVPAQAEAARRTAQGATSGAPRATSGGDDVFAQARSLLDHLEREFRARESALDSREAALASREEELADARAVFQETVQRASERHQGAEAVLAMKTRELARLREDTERDAEITNAGLDQHRRKVKALTERLIEQRSLLEDREASAAEASAKLRPILVAVLAAEKRAAQTSELQLALQKQERVVDALWDDLAVKDAANAVLDGALKKTVEQLGEAAQREATAREEAAAALARLAGKEEEAITAAKRAADLERNLTSLLREHGIGMSRLREAVDQAANTMRRVGLVPAERSADFPHDKLEDHARFLDSLSGQLAELREAFEDTLSREGKQVAETLATHILSRLHHRDPSFPVDAIFTRITPQAERERAEAAVAGHVAELVRRMARH